MRYHIQCPEVNIAIFGEIYTCDHPVYSSCTLFRRKNRGLAVIQQYFDPETKHSWWAHIEPWIANEIYLSPKFPEYFEKYASDQNNGIFPTVSMRQIMWALRIKPIPRKPWETLFDHCPI